MNYQVQEYAGRAYYPVRNGLAETYAEAQEIAKHYKGSRIMERTKDGLGWRRARLPVLPD